MGKNSVSDHYELFSWQNIL